jgi:hypothetical protein
MFFWDTIREVSLGIIIVEKVKRKRGGQIEIPPKQYKKKKIEYLLHRPEKC